MKKRKKRLLVNLIKCVVLGVILSFSIYGIRCFASLKRQQNQEVTITSTELEEILEQKEMHFLLQDQTLIEELEKEYYANSSQEEQLEILARIGSLEAEYLGISIPEFKLAYLRNDLGGYYNHEEHQVVLNIQHISHEMCSIRTVIHEMFHAYQYACVREVNSDSNLLVAREIAVWREEIMKQTSYDMDSNEGLVDYYVAATEESAREYAEKRTKIYFLFIEPENEE